MLPNVAGTVSLTPVLAGVLPALTVDVKLAAHAVAPELTVAYAPTGSGLLPEAGPMTAVATSTEKPSPAIVKEREVERSRLLVERMTTVKELERRPDSGAAPSMPLDALMAKLDELADRPVEVNLTVVSKLDGRTIAQAVYRDIRQQKVKNYETL